MKKILSIIFLSIIFNSNAQQIKIDTILDFKNYTIAIKTTNTKIFPLKSDFEKRIDSITSKYGNSHIKSRSREQLFIEKYTTLVRKDSTRLFLKLDTGEWKLIELSTIADEYENTLDNFYENENLYLVRTQWGEGNGYKLVDKKDGIIIDTFGEPYFSKDGKFIISVNVDLVAGYTENGFEFFDRTNNKIETIGKFNPNNWGPEWGKYISDNKFIIKCYSLDNYLKQTDFFIELNFNKKR
jgi:hypothetical protein